MQNKNQNGTVMVLDILREITMIIMLSSQKGGSGKTTIAVNLCSYLALMGKDVMLIDSDRQGTASNWLFDRCENKDLPLVHGVQKYENISGSLKDFKKRYEYVIVDSPGRDSREMRTGMVSADFILIPVRCSQPDLDTLAKMQEIVNEVRDMNPKVKVKGLLTMASANPVVNEIQEAQDYAKDYPGIPLLSTIIFDRKIYRDGMSLGKGVLELSNDKAKKEMKSLAKEIFDA